MCFPCRHRHLKKLLELEISSNFYAMLVAKALEFIYKQSRELKKYHHISQKSIIYTIPPHQFKLS